MSAVEHAIALLKARRPREALSVLGTHLASQPDDPDALRIAGAAYYDLGAYGVALAQAQRAASIDPDSAGAWSLIGLTRAKLGDDELARIATTEARRLAPEDPVTLTAAVNVDVHINAVTTETVAAARQLVDIAPDDPDSHVTLASALLASNDIFGADAALREALRIDPQHREALNDFNAVSQRSGTPLHSLVGFSRLLAENPTDPVLQFNAIVSLDKALFQLHFMLFPAICAALTIAANAGAVIGYGTVVVGSGLTVIVVVRAIRRARRINAAPFLPVVKRVSQLDRALRFRVGLSWTILVTMVIAALIPIPVVSLGMYSIAAAMWFIALIARRFHTWSLVARMPR